MCLLGIEAPSESFNRWLLERKVVDQKPVDPLLPCSCPVEISASMHRELMNDIPMRLVKPKYATDARRQLVKYAESATRMVESRGASLDSRKVVKWHAEDALAWLRKQRNASYEDLWVSHTYTMLVKPTTACQYNTIQYTVSLIPVNYL